MDDMVSFNFLELNNTLEIELLLFADFTEVIWLLLCY